MATAYYSEGSDTYTEYDLDYPEGLPVTIRTCTSKYDGAVCTPTLSGTT